MDNSEDLSYPKTENHGEPDMEMSVDQELPMVIVEKEIEQEYPCGRYVFKPYRGWRSYGVILDGMLANTMNEKAVSAAEEKWMAKPVISPAKLANCILEALKRANSQSWIGGQLKWFSPVELIMFHRNGGVKGNGPPAKYFKAVMDKDKKLVEFLDRLRQRSGYWETAIDVIFRQIKYQLASDRNLNAAHREALCRFGFYLCRLHQNGNSLTMIREILLLALRRHTRPKSYQQRLDCNGVVYCFVALAMVWPSAFRKIILEQQPGDYGRITQATFRFILKKHRIHSKIFCCLDDSGHRLDRYEDWSLVPLIEEQLNQFPNFASIKFDVDGVGGIRMPDEMLACFEKLLIMAPYCDDESFTGISVRFLNAIADWRTTAADNPVDPKVLIPIILWVSKICPFQPRRAIMACYDDILESLRSICFNYPSTETDRMWVKHSASALVTILERLVHGDDEKVREAQSFIKRLSANEKTVHGGTGMTTATVKKGSPRKRVCRK